MRQRAWEVLDAAWALGVRYFDCARSYGRSEEFLSGWLQAKGLNKEEVAVGSKWGYRYTAGWRVDTGGQPHEIKDHSLMHLERQQEETQGLLGEHLRLYQIHSATLESGVLEDKGVLQALRGLRDERGWRMGLSLSGVKQGATLEKALETKVFDSVQATWNLLEQSAGPALERAKEEGLEVIVKEAMANGRILRRPELARAAQALGVAPDALALGAVMAQGFEPMVLSGAVTAAQLESNLGAVAAAEKLTEDGGQRLEQLMAELRQEPSSYWQERSELEWQ